MSNLIVTTRLKSGPKQKYRDLAHQIESMSTGEPMSGCWLWTGSVDKKGYGQLTHKREHMTAHRASFSAFKGSPAGMLVCHDCDQPSCVNPAHLYAGTHANNHADALNRRRWSHPYAKRENCSAGHSYALFGVSMATDGSRVCKECQRKNKQNQRSK